MRRRPVADRGPAPLVVRVCFGKRDEVVEWSPATPPRGWDFPAARAAALRWAGENHAALGVDRERLAYSALRALCGTVDRANGRTAGNRDSLTRAQMIDRLDRRTS